MNVVVLWLMVMATFVVWLHGSVPDAVAFLLVVAASCLLAQLWAWMRRHSDTLRLPYWPGCVLNLLAYLGGTAAGWWLA